jgi:hypothetical protein
LAISGHSFWNGSLFIIGAVSEKVNPLLGLLAMLGWLVILIFMLWYCSLRILPSLFTTVYREKSLDYGDGHTL